MDARLAEADILSADLRRRELGCYHALQARMACREVLLLVAACTVASHYGWCGPLASRSSPSATACAAFVHCRSLAAREASGAYAGLIQRQESRLRCVRSLP